MAARTGIFLLAAVIALMVGPRSADAQCNEKGFLCTGLNTYKFCIDGGPPDFEYSCEPGTGCYMSCAAECSIKDCAPPVCNSASYFCTDQNHYMRCVDNSSVPSGPEIPCAEGSGYTCSTNCNAQTYCSKVACPVTCNETSRQAIPGDPSSYYLCTVDSAKEVTVTTRKCPPSTEFSALKSACTAITTTPATTTTTTTTPKPFECTLEGRFPHPIVCKKYYLCINGTNGFKAYEYECSGNAVYHAASGKCSTNSSYCEEVYAQPVALSLGPVCLNDGERAEDPTSCSHYYICAWTEEEWVTLRHTCPEKTVFNPYISQCTAEKNYSCNLN